MLQLRYPSKEFGSAWRKAVDSGIEFEVDARIGRFTKSSMKFHIDASFGHPHSRRRFGSLAATLFTGDIMICIAATSLSNKYDAQYSDSEKGLLITFCRV